MIEEILNIKNSIYSSNLNEEHLKNKIEDIFEQKTLNLTGKFTNQTQFTAFDKWTYIKWYVPNFRRNTAYLKGEILKSEKGSLIKLNMKPNPVISIFPIFSVFIGVILLIITASNKENDRSLIIGLIIIGVGILYYLFGMYLRNRLQNNFDKYLDFQKV